MRRGPVAAVAIALVLLTIAYRILSMGGSLGGFENDQFVTLSQAQQVAMGDWPMRDFVELGMPLTVMLSAAGQLLFGHTLFAEALLTSGLIGISTAILFVLAWRASGSMLVALLVALLQIAMAPRFYNYPKLLAYAIAIPVFWWYIDRPTRPRLALIALAGVIAFLFRHDHGVYVGLTAVVAVALAQQADVRRVTRELALLGAIAVALALPYLLFIQGNGGVVPYFSTFVRYANQTAERTTLQSARLSFDWSQPLATRVAAPQAQPRINVRWAEGVTQAQRAEREQALGLVEGEARSAEVINYALTDASTERLSAIVHDSAVADTAGIDRQAFVLNDPEYTRVPTAAERAMAYAGSVRLLPGVLRGENAVPFLYFLLWCVPIAALVLAFYRGNGAGSAWRESSAKISTTAVLALLIDQGFLRGSLPSRLADVTEPVGVLAAWLAAVCLARASRPARWAAAIALLLVFAVASMSVEAIERVSAQVRQSALLSGEVRDRAANIHTLLSASPPVAAWSPDTPGMERVARYVNSCTAPDDRVLTLGYIPELFFMSQRRFAAGHVWIQPKFFDTDADQRVMIERIRRYRVPIVITVPEPEFTTEYVASFPVLTRMLASEYQEISTSDFGRGFRFRVLARRDVTPAGTVPPDQLPCFSASPPGG